MQICNQGQILGNSWPYTEHKIPSYYIFFYYYQLLLFNHCTNNRYQNQNRVWQFSCSKGRWRGKEIVPVSDGPGLQSSVLSARGQKVKKSVIRVWGVWDYSSCLFPGSSMIFTAACTVWTCTVHWLLHTRLWWRSTGQTQWLQCRSESAVTVEDCTLPVGSRTTTSDVSFWGWRKC